MYLIRTSGPEQVRALQVKCPHLGCAVGLAETTEDGQKVKKFFCPCHSASFDLEGTRLDETSPSPRDMDALEVDADKLPEVWVKYFDYRTGTPDKVPTA